MALRVTGYLGLDGSGFFGTLGAAEARAGRFASGVSGALKSKFAAVFSVGAVGMQFKSAIDYATQLQDAVGRAGDASAEELQRIGRAAEDHGSSLEEVLDFWNQINIARRNALQTPDGKDAAAFKSLGFNDDQMKTATQREMTVHLSRALRESNSELQTMGLLAEIGGRNAKRMTELLRSGFDQQYQDTLVLSQAQVDALDELSDRWTEFSRQLKVRFGSLLLDLIKQVENVPKEGRGGMLQRAIPYSHLADPQFWNAPSGGVLKDIIRIINPMENLTSALWKSNQVMNEQLREEQDEPAKKAQPITTEPLKFSDFDKAEAISKARKLGGGDSLLTVGNFLGASQSTLASINSRILEVNRLQLIELRGIAAAVKSGGFGLEFPS